MHRPIAIGDRDYTICGRSGDRYFDTVSVGDVQSDFLIYSTQFLPPESVTLDIGANIGVTALVTSHCIHNATVHAFEPHPETFDFLTQTIAANGLTQVHPCPVALGASAGTASFALNPRASSGSHLGAPQAMVRSDIAETYVDVAVKTADQMVGELQLDRLDFVKIDVEGFELDVLAGARELLRGYRPPVLLEFNSFTIIAFADMNPRAFLQQILGLFPYVYALSDGRHWRIADDSSIFRFIHTNLVHHGCVDDLLCTFDPLP